MAHYQQTKIDVGSLRTELQDTIHEFQRERADMFLSLRSLDQQLQLKAFIIDVSSMHLRLTCTNTLVFGVIGERYTLFTMSHTGTRRTQWTVSSLLRVPSTHF